MLIFGSMNTDRPPVSTVPTVEPGASAYMPWLVVGLMERSKDLASRSNTASSSGESP